ncbi:MAG TPA: NADH-quinone oxidoreductase subunit C [Jatrophihabitans sp.]|jgi:NADH-quinone oxidoreductase subunit C
MTGIQRPGGENSGESSGEDESTFGTERHGLFGVSGSGDTSGFGGLVREPWVAPEAERPYGGYFDELVDTLAIAYPQLGEAVIRTIVDRGELTLHLEREHLLGVAAALRNDPNLRFELLSSVAGVDYLDPSNPESKRLHAVYELRSMTYRRRLRLEVAASVADPHIPSVVGLYPTADWQERETFDLFGIVFDGHPALTRILMPDDWDGHPQRKDYPLGGIAVEYKGATIPPPDQRRAYR